MGSINRTFNRAAVTMRVQMLKSNFFKRASAIATIIVGLVAVAAPNAAQARHGNGAAIALGVLGGALVGATIASSPSPAHYVPAPSYYYAPQPYYPAPAYYAPPAYYQRSPYGYADYGYDE